MSCAYVLLFVLVLTASVVSTFGAPRIPRQLHRAGAHHVLRWGENLRLFMHDNGTVQLRPSRSDHCSECDFDIEYFCARSNFSGCPKRRLKPRKVDNITSTIVMLKFAYAGKYLCMNRNATFYTLVNPDADGRLEECTFYVVNQKKTGRVLLYHFKYPEKKRNCRLSERRRGKNNLCVKYFLKKGNDNSLTTFKGKLFTESRWLLVGFSSTAKT